MGSPATANRTSITMIMIIAVPRSGCTSTRRIGMPAMISSRKTSRQAKPSASRRAQYADTARYQGEHGELRGLQLQRAPG